MSRTMAIAMGDEVTARGLLANQALEVLWVIKLDGSRVVRAARQDVAFLEVAGPYSRQRYRVPIDAVESVNRINLASKLGRLV